MALNVHQKRKAVDFGRVSRGFLWSSLVTTDATGSDPAPSVPRRFLASTSGALVEGVPAAPLLLAGPSCCIQADLFRPYLMAVGIGFKGPTRTNGISMFNNALNSSVDFYSNTAEITTPSARSSGMAINPFELTWVNACKTEVSPTLGLRAWADNGAYSGGWALATQDFPWTPLMEGGSDANVKVGGNRYDAAFRNVYAMKSNALDIVGLPAYGSLALSINGAAEVVVNLDGNGDGSFDFNATVFPCKVAYRVFDGADKGGTLRGQFVVYDTFGGDSIGTTRAVLQSYPFSPKSISSLISWHAPESIGGNTGDAFNSWPDSSGFNRPLAKSGVAAPKVQTAAYNGKAVVRFDGSGQLLFSDAIATALRIKQTGTVAVALRWAPGNATKGLLSMMAGGSQGFNMKADGAGIEGFLAGDNGGVVGYNSGFGAANTIHVLVFEFDALRSRVRAWWSSTARPSTGAAADVDAARLIQWSTSLPAFTLGTFYADAGAATPALYGVGDVGEVIAYGKRLRPADRAALMTYLNARWL
jgi:hypothetical protein